MSSSPACFETPDLTEIKLPDVLAALGDPVRLRILLDLRQSGERPSSAFEVDVSASTLSHHIKTLRLAGLVQHRREGVRCFVSLRPGIEQRFPGLVENVLAHADALSERVGEPVTIA